MKIDRSEGALGEQKIFQTVLFCVADCGRRPSSFPIFCYIKLTFQVPCFENIARRIEKQKRGGERFLNNGKFQKLRESSPPYERKIMNDG